EGNPAKLHGRGGLDPQGHRGARAAVRNELQRSRGGVGVRQNGSRVRIDGDRKRRGCHRAAGAHGLQRIRSRSGGPDDGRTARTGPEAGSVIVARPALVVVQESVTSFPGATCPGVASTAVMANAGRTVMRMSSDT